MTKTHHPLQVSYRKPSHCSICNCTALTDFGEKDFGHSGNDKFTGTRNFADYGVMIRYYRCQQCGFLFTPAFDDWSAEQFAEHIYNAQYIKADPPFDGERAAANADRIDELLGDQKGTLTLLDFGGGNGTLARQLCRAGFSARSHDVYYGHSDITDACRFDVVTSFEVLEHVPHAKQLAWLRELESRLVDSSAIAIVSTELRNEAVPDENNISWWYICPRNGHISLHTKTSLAHLAAQAGLVVTHLDASWHVLSRPSVPHARKQWENLACA